MVHVLGMQQDQQPPLKLVVDRANLSIIKTILSMEVCTKAAVWQYLEEPHKM